MPRQALPPYMIEQLGTAGCLDLARCTKADAKTKYSHIPQSEEDLAIMLSWAKEDLVNTSTYVTKEQAQTRRLFMAAAWLAGASWNQISSLFGVSQPTVVQAANRILPPDAQARAAMRMGGPFSYGRLQIMAEKYKAADAITTQIDVQSLAMWLRTNSTEEV